MSPVKTYRQISGNKHEWESKGTDSSLNAQDSDWDLYGIITEHNDENVQ